MLSYFLQGIFVTLSFLGSYFLTDYSLFVQCVFIYILYNQGFFYSSQYVPAYSSARLTRRSSFR